MNSTPFTASKVLFFGLLVSLMLAGPTSAAVLSTDVGGTSSTTTGSGCTITSFTANPSTTNNGTSATLNWTTTGCMNTILNGGIFTGTQLQPMNGSASTGPLNGTTRFVLSANGASGSTTAATTVSVTDTQYPYSYACGTLANNPDPSCDKNYDGKFITTAATNVGATTARLNGIALNTLDSFSAYFEYGTTPNLGQATSFQALGNVTTFYVNETIPTKPNTRYYYRFVSQIVGGPIVRGNILTFTTAPAGSDSSTYATDSNGTQTQTTNGTSSGTTTTSSGTTGVQAGTTTTKTAATIDGVQVTVTTKEDKIKIGDTVAYTVVYKNGTGKTLHDAALTVVFPLGFTVKQSTQGSVTNTTTIAIPLGVLSPEESGSVFIETVVGQNTTVDTTLVTTATLTYALPSNVRDSAVGYFINHASADTAFAGLALGTGFFPTTLFGWLITTIIILTLILIARRIAKQKEGGHGGGHGGGHH